MSQTPPIGGDDQENARFPGHPVCFRRMAADPSVGLDVLVTKVAVDFLGLTSRSRRQLHQAQPRRAARRHQVDAHLHRPVRRRTERTVERVASATGLLAPFDPQVFKGEVLAERLPYLGAKARTPARRRDSRHAGAAARTRRRCRALRRTQRAFRARLRAVAQRSRLRFHGALRVATTPRWLGREPAPDAEARRRRASPPASTGCALRVTSASSRNAMRSRCRRPTTACGISTSRHNTVYFSPRWRKMLGLRRARSARVARLAAARASGRHGARAGADPRSHRGQDADVRKRASHASLQWRVALGRQPRQGARRRDGAAAPARRRRVRHHRAQALRGRAVQGKGKRADHAAIDRRRRDHDRRAPGASNT